MEDLKPQTLIERLELKKEDNFVIIYDSGVVRIAVPIFNAAEEINGDNSKAYCLDIYADRKTSEVPAQIRKAIEKADVSLLVTSSTKAEKLESLAKSITNAIRAKSNYRFANAMGVNNEDFLEPKSVEYLSKGY